MCERAEPYAGLPGLEADGQSRLETLRAVTAAQAERREPGPGSRLAEDLGVAGLPAQPKSLGPVPGGGLEVAAGVGHGGRRQPHAPKQRGRQVGGQALLTAPAADVRLAA